MREIIYREPRAYTTCPFCGTFICEDNRTWREVSDDVYNEYYVCPECEAECDVAFFFSTCTWSSKDDRKTIDEA